MKVRRQCYYCDGTGRDPASSEKSSDSESSGSIFDLFFKSLIPQHYYEYNFLST